MLHFLRPGDSPLTPIHFFSVLRRHANIVVVVFAFFILSSLVAFLLLPRTYEASAWLVVDFSRDRLGKEENSNLSKAELDEYLRSQVAIVQSEDVIREAIRTYGADRLFAGDRAGENEDSAYLAAMSRLSAAVEPNTALIRVRYRANKPEISADFANTVAASYLAKFQKIYSNPQATSFFAERQQDFNQRFRGASAKLQDFTVKHNAYAIEDQRLLMLRRRDKMTADLVAAQGQISRLRSELDSLTTQLASMRKAYNFPVEVSGKDTAELYVMDRTNNAAGRMDRTNNAAGRTAPIVVIQMYLNTVDTLARKKAELSGYQALAAHLETSLAEMETRLKSLSEVQAEYSGLQQEVKNSETFADVLFKRYAEAQADNAWRSNEHLSTIQIMQVAKPPLRPAFPKGSLFLGFGSLLGLLAACSAALVADSLGRSIKFPELAPFFQKLTPFFQTFGRIPRAAVGLHQIIAFKVPEIVLRPLKRR
jgi:polysaccharide biosynthesis transport protein